MTSSDRSQILNRVRSSLGKSLTAPASSITQTSSQKIQTYLNEHFNQAASSEALLQTFSQQIRHQNSSLDRLQSKQQIPQAIADYFQQRQAHSSQPQAACSISTIQGWPEFESLDWAQARLNFCSDNQPNNDFAGLTGCLFAIAETGTLAIQNSTHRKLKPSLVPETHIVVVEQRHILPTLFHSAKMIDLADPFAQLVFISGPSRTADIEQTLVLGAHGPRYVHLLLILENVN